MEFYTRSVGAVGAVQRNSMRMAAAEEEREAEKKKATSAASSAAQTVKKAPYRSWRTSRR